MCVSLKSLLKVYVSHVFQVLKGTRTKHYTTLSIGVSTLQMLFDETCSRRELDNVFVKGEGTRRINDQSKLTRRYPAAPATNTKGVCTKESDWLLH